MEKVPIFLRNGLKAIGKWWISLHLGHILNEFLEDILIFSGLFFIVLATFQINRIAGFYCLGVCLFSLGVYFTPKFNG